LISRWAEFTDARTLVIFAAHLWLTRQKQWPRCWARISVTIPWTSSRCFCCDYNIRRLRS